MCLKIIQNTLLINKPMIWKKHRYPNMLTCDKVVLAVRTSCCGLTSYKINCYTNASSYNFLPYTSKAFACNPLLWTGNKHVNTNDKLG